jgi:hypothetical protein
MNAREAVSNALAIASRRAKLIPGLLRHDPLFRYAAIAAALALFFLGARLAQDIAGPGALPQAGQDRTEENNADPSGRSAADVEPPRPGSAATLPDREDVTPAEITPGRSLENLEVEPAPKDSFGTLPEGEPDP